MLKLMVVLLVAAVAICAVVAPSSAAPFTYSPFGLQIDLGAGVTWDHSTQGKQLEFQSQPWLSGGITKQMGGRFTLSGVFERVTVQAPEYQVRGGVFYRLGP